MARKFLALFSPAQGVIMLLGVVTIGAGIGVYYTNNYGYYQQQSSQNIIVAHAQGGRFILPVKAGSKEIQSKSSPLRFRACLRIGKNELITMEKQDYVRIEAAEPRIAPKIFSCFDAVAIGKALEQKHAHAFLSQRNIQPGIDRVGAVFPDGRVYMWHRLNRDYKF